MQALESEGLLNSGESTGAFKQIQGTQFIRNKQANKQTNKNNNNKKERGRKWRIRSALPKLSMHRQYRRTTEDQNTPRTVRLWREEAKANKPGSLQAQLSVLCIFTRTQETPAPCAATLGRLFFHFSTNALWVMAPSA